MSNKEKVFGIFDFFGLEITFPMMQKIFMIEAILIILEFAMVLFLLKLFIFKMPQDISQVRKIVIGSIIDVGIFLILITSIMYIGTMEVFSLTPHIIAIFPYLCLSLLTKTWSGYKSNKSRFISSFLEYLLLMVLFWINALSIMGVAKSLRILPHYL